MFEHRKLSELRELSNNPRKIKPKALKTLCKSIEESPEYFEARPLILSDRTGSLVIIAGNQRFKAASFLKLKTVPTFLLSGLTEEKEREIIIRDNVNNGEWDFEMLDMDYTVDELSDWGLEMPEVKIPGEEDDDEGSEPDAPEPEVKKWAPDCLFPSNNEFDIPTLKPATGNVYVELPLKPWGADGRTKTGVGTYHFYVDDYRFSTIWDDPTRLIQSGCKAIVEPNLSLYETTPVSYGVFMIYKKRWIARYLQDFDINVFVDLNVTEKFMPFNIMGIPDGYNAFFTRGYDNRLKALAREYEVAQKISGLETPNLIIYGGSKSVKKFATDHNLTFINNTTLDI